MPLSSFSMRKLVRWLPAVLLLGSASCSFLLDFDELTAESGDAGSDSSLGGTGGSGGGGGASGSGGASGGGGASGSGASGGSAGDAGDAGDGGCSVSCDDNDPCTTDACYVPEGGAPFCVHGGKLFADGELDLPVEEYLGGLSVAAGPGGFYVSKYFGKNKDAALLEYDTSVFSVPVAGTLAKGNEYVLGPGFGGGPRGPVSLVHDGTKLFGFVAVQFSGFDWRVKQLEFPSDLASAPVEADLCGTNCYDWSLDGTRRPKGFLDPSGTPRAMWVGPAGIWIGNQTQKPVAKTITASQVTGLAPVVSKSAVGAFWRDDTTLRVTMLGSPQTETKPTFCDATKGFFGGLAAAGRGRFWTTALTTNIVAAGPSTEFNSFLVEGTQVGEISNCKDPGSLVQGVNLPSLAAFKRPATSPDERVHLAIAAVTAGDLSLGLSASYLELAPGKAELVGVAKFESDKGPISALAGSKGVDEAAVAYAGEKLLMAWRDSATSGGSKATLRLRRFKFCQ